MLDMMRMLDLSDNASAALSSLAVALFSLVSQTLSLQHAFVSLSRASLRLHLSSTFDMDPLSAAASIIAILQLSSKVVGYLNDVKDAPKDRAKCAMEAANLNSLLTNLRFRLEERDPNTSWYTAVQALGVENGPLDQFKQVLEQLQSNMTGGGIFKRTSDALVWKFKKEEVASMLGRMERLKTLVQIALENDHLLVSMMVFGYIVERGR